MRKGGVRMPVRGGLIPTCTRRERLKIVNPVLGEMFLQTDSAKGLYIFTPGGWKVISTV
jgi:hypothetical protein